ncbi:MAG: UDP-N-acetylmuramate dehydrogenase [Candidatus Paceibacterota bacterium]|jgi:UDP-N-acetylmuramate dehydrogenase
MEILKNYNLLKLNTFGISVQAKFFVEVKSEKDLEELFNLSEFKNNKKMFLGGGSNILFTKDFDGIVILNKLKGIDITEEDSENVYIRAMGGEYWNDLVMFSVDRGYWGIENLTLIPGTVGAAPIENIGAYGVELADVLESVEAYRILNKEKTVFKKEECEFSYHDSVFKNKFKGEYFIFAITLKLSKISMKNINYRGFSEYVEKNKIGLNSSKDISNAIAFMRKTKLPDPAVLGNVGSFFRNVFLEKEKIQTLLETYPDMPHYQEGGITKIPAAWLIEQRGWKGKKVGNVGVHEKHALVLVNYGGATGLEILELANKIIISVKEKFGVDLVPEVNLI